MLLYLSVESVRLRAFPFIRPTESFLQIQCTHLIFLNIHTPCGCGRECGWETDARDRCVEECSLPACARGGNGRPRVREAIKPWLRNWCLRELTQTEA